MESFDVAVLGGGPAGLAAAVSACDMGGSTIIIEREERIGGILKQCIHDGFGLIKFKERLTGPEYAERYIRMVQEKGIPVKTSTFATAINKNGNGFDITLINSESGLFDISAKALVLANGCRERTSRQVFIQGTRPAGIYTAGTAQHLVNIQGYLPCKRCVILGSGDIGLIMARRLTLEGAKVVGVYEAKSAPSGLSRNIVQCLEDYGIPLHLSHTITKVFGDDRVEAVEISQVDEKMVPLKGSEEIIECDGVILSVGLIPENETAEKLGVSIDPMTRGPYVDQDMMTDVCGVFSCGNALHVNDLVDYVSESGELAGLSAARFARENIKRKVITVKVDTAKFLYAVPQYINISSVNKKVIWYFRSRDVRSRTMIEVTAGDRVLMKRPYRQMKPPEMERIEVNLDYVDLKDDEKFQIKMVEG